MPRKKNWRMASAKLGNQSRTRNDIRLVDTSHVKNSTKDPTIDITADGPLRLVEASHVKNSAKDWGDTASLKRVLDLPSGTSNIANLPSGARNIAKNNAMNFTNLPSGAINSSDMPLGTMNSASLPSSIMNSNSLPSDFMKSDNMSFYLKKADNSPKKKTMAHCFSSQSPGQAATCMSSSKKNLPMTKLFGTINQASNLFPAFSRGVQCTCNALMSIILQNASTSVELDGVLIAGDDLFRIRIAELKSNVQFVSKMLQFQELPRSVYVHNNQYEICYFEEIYGTVTHIDWEESCQSNNLKQGIESLFRHSQGLIIVGGICSAIYMNDKNCPVFFDSHSHGEDGLSCADGKAIKITFSDIDQLVDYMFAFYHSCNISMISQFEIQPVSVTRKTRMTISGSKRPSLIDTYFEFQENMSRKFIISESPQGNRKEYMKNYMRKRRENSGTRKSDNALCATSKNRARQSEEFRKKELISKQIARENPETRQKDRQSAFKSRTKARKSKEFKEKELAFKKIARENPETKQKDRESALKSKTKARLSKEYKDKELAAKKSARENPETKQKDRDSSLKSKTKARQSKEFKEKELSSKKIARENPETKQTNRESTLKCMNKARKSKEFKEKELASKKVDREKPETKQRDRESTLKSMNKARLNVDFSLNEREAKQKKRDDAQQLEKERLFKQQSRRNYREKERENERVSKAEKRLDEEFKDHEKKLLKKRFHGNSLEDCIKKFHDQVKIGPIYVCTCCHQTWFLKSVVKLDATNLSASSKSICTGFRSVDDIEWLCLTCCSALKDEKIPKLSVRNGMKWPNKPDALNLHPLEERLISLRIPFMQIRELPRGGQMSVKGNVVNVPVDIQPTMNALPRQMDEHVTIAVKLKKRLSHKSACFTENVHPNMVINALQWLMTNSELYKNSGILLDNSWKDDIE